MEVSVPLVPRTSPNARLGGKEQSKPTRKSSQSQSAAHTSSCPCKLPFDAKTTPELCFLRPSYRRGRTDRRAANRALFSLLLLFLSLSVPALSASSANNPSHLICPPYAAPRIIKRRRLDGIPVNAKMHRPITSLRRLADFPVRRNRPR